MLANPYAFKKSQKSNNTRYGLTIKSGQEFGDVQIINTSQTDVADLDVVLYFDGTVLDYKQIFGPALSLIPVDWPTQKPIVVPPVQSKLERGADGKWHVDNNVTGFAKWRPTTQSYRLRIPSLPIGATARVLFIHKPLKDYPPSYVTWFGSSGTFTVKRGSEIITCSVNSSMVRPSALAETLNQRDHK